MNPSHSGEKKSPLLFRGTSESLGIARFSIYAIWFIVVARTDFAGLADMPGHLYEPVGVCRLLGDSLPEYLSTAFLGGFRIFLLILTALLALGIRPFRPLSITAAISLLFFDCYLKGFAPFINHSQVGVLYAALALTIFPASDSYSLFPLRPKKPSTPALYQAAMSFPIFAFTLAYAFVGIRRIALGTEVLWNNSLPGWIITRTLEPVNYGFDWGLAVISSDLVLWAAKAGFALITVCEILSPLCLFNDKFRRFWLCVVIPFHFSTLFFMNIFFWENLLIIIVCFTGVSYHLLPSLITSLQMRRSIRSQF